MYYMMDDGELLVVIPTVGSSVEWKICPSIHFFKTHLVSCDYLKWDLEIMLARLPLLKELVCNGNPQVTGDRQHQQFESAQEYP